MGGSSSINGTGFMICKEVIDRYGFKTVTLTEDIEFAGHCALKGIKIAFVEDAITYDEQPVKFIPSLKQRMRWTMGMVSCMRKYSWNLIKMGIKKRSLACIDISFFYMAAAVQVLQLIVLGMYSLIVNFNFGAYKIIGLLSNTKGYTFILSYLFCILLAVVVLLMSKKNVLKSIKGVLTLFVFMLTWVPIMIICLFKKNYKWEQMDHNISVDIDAMKKNN
jgi:cellulose synthase/poly-beta-1,6-N-acetylglucosamine synthase-like glycosyltransferase